MRPDPVFTDWSDLSAEARADLFLAQLGYARAMLEHAQEGLVHSRDVLFAHDAFAAARAHAIAADLERAVEDLDAGGWPSPVRALVLEAENSAAVMAEHFPGRVARLKAALRSVKLWGR